MDEPKVRKEFTDLQRVVNAYKISKGIEIHDRGWDKYNFPRYSKAAIGILECFGGSLEQAVLFVIAKSEDFNAKGISYTLETILRHAWDSKGEMNGLQQKKVDADSLLGRRDTPRITQKGNGPTKKEWEECFLPRPEIHPGPDGEIPS